MATFMDERALLRSLHERLDDWVSAARREAYAEQFEGPEPVLSEADLGRLDGIDSELSRASGRGLWGADEYGIVASGTIDEESAPQVVCTYHPQIPEYVNRAGAPIDEATRERFNAVLWDYAERVAELAQADLESAVASSEVEFRRE